MTIKNDSVHGYFLIFFIVTSPQSLGEHCTTWLSAEAEYHVDTSVIQLFPEKHNHEKLLLYHNIDRAQTYRSGNGKLRLT